MSSAATAAALPATGDYPVLRDDPRGFPRALHLLAALVEAEVRRSAAATAAAESDLARSFRGGAGATTPTISIGDFLERIQFFIRFKGSCYVVVGVYMIRFLRSPATREAGLPVGPHTAHRLVATAFFLATKFVGLLIAPAKVFEVSSCGAIRAGEMAALECAFLRALGCRLFVHVECLKWSCGVLKLRQQEEEGGGAVVRVELAVESDQVLVAGVECKVFGCRVEVQDGRRRESRVEKMASDLFRSSAAGRRMRV
ncbi:hypothetical protein ACP70R_022954 [Stipagrostis hirtigluma subsp. patula]